MKTNQIPKIQDLAEKHARRHAEQRDTAQPRIIQTTAVKEAYDATLNTGEPVRLQPAQRDTAPRKLGSKGKWVKCNQDEFQLPLDLLKFFGCNKPSEYARLVYESNDCGPWTSFLILKNGEVEAIPSGDLSEYQDTTEWAVRNLIGIRHGTIVEGSEVTFVSDDLIFPFSEQQREEALSYLDAEASIVWDEANDEEVIHETLNAAEQQRDIYKAHAEALAEALEAALDQLAMRGANRTATGLPDPIMKQGREALAKWEGAKQ